MFRCPACARASYPRGPCSGGERAGGRTFAEPSCSPEHTHPECILSPWKLGERRITLRPFTLAAGAARVAPFDRLPPPAAWSHTVVESSLLFSGYGGALRGSSAFACSESLWWGYGGGLRPRRPSAVVAETEPVRLYESPFTGCAGEYGSSLWSMAEIGVSMLVGGQQADGGWIQGGWPTDGWSLSGFW